jgi:hypothetical protein
MLLGACSTSETAESPTTTGAVDTETTVATASPSTTAEPTTTEAIEVADTGDEAEEVETSDPVDVEAGCDWDSGRVTSDDPGSAPASEGAELSETILGSWQHTHIDDGAGFEPVRPTTDIRYVLSADTFLYCQDVEGATDQAERSAPMKIEGNEIILPSPASGYAVTAWNDDTMVWLNHFDDSLYLLQRR